MRWCKCPQCSHKLFLYEPDEKSGRTKINIKCSSCKRIIDVLILNGKVKTKVYENVEKT